MKKNSFLIIIGAALFVEACSLLSIQQKNTSAQQFDLIRIGQTASDVKKLVGEPSEFRTKKDTEIWIYNNPDEYGTQRGAISLDSKTKLVDSVTVIPFVNDSDAKLEYLKKQKFPALDYVEIPLARCHRDFFPREIFYISPSKGVIIEVDSLNNLVESYSLSSSLYASDLIRKIKNCER